MIVDPVMGDNGKAYSIVSNESFVMAIRDLCCKADVITPNLTECSLLLGMGADGYEDTPEAAEDYMRRLAAKGPGQVVVTGLSNGEQVGAGYYDKAPDTVGFIFHERVPTYFPGTGDLFTSVLTARLSGEQKCSLEKAVSDAAHFVMECAKYTHEQGTPPIEGVQFEKLLYKLIRQEV